MLAMVRARINEDKSAGLPMRGCIKFFKSVWIGFRICFFILEKPILRADTLYTYFWLGLNEVFL